MGILSGITRSAHALVDHTGITGVGGGSSAFSGARVYRTTDQALSGTGLLLFTTEVYDTDAYHDTGSNTGRLTVPATGYYHIGASIELEVLSGAGDYFWSVSLFYDGTTEIATFRNPAGATLAGRTPAVTISTDYLATAGHYFTVQASMTATTYQADAGDRGPIFWIHRLG